MTGIYFTADLHLGHINIAALRGFTSTEYHDRTIADRWDAAVRPDDQVWVLGDISLGRKGAPAALEWIAARPGIKHLIPGNHDPCHPMHSTAHKYQRTYLDVFESVQQSAVRKLDGHRVLLSHFPFEGDHTDIPRYPEYRFPDTGQWLLHGHTHSPIKQRGRQLHVGVDAHNLAPVPLSWVRDRISQGVAQWEAQAITAAITAGDHA